MRSRPRTFCASLPVSEHLTKGDALVRFLESHEYIYGENCFENPPEFKNGQWWAILPAVN